MLECTKMYNKRAVVNDIEVAEPKTAPSKPQTTPKPVEKPTIPEKPLHDPFTPIGPNP